MELALQKIRQDIFPIVKWVGGKRQLMSELLDNLPSSFDRYLEPFVGGGALFFELQVQNAYISDINDELINLYLVVRDKVDELIDDLKKHDLSKEYFMKIRNVDRLDEYRNWSDVKKASRFIYLNRTCFNGMYRVNSRGEFNVPFGRYKNPRIVDESNLINCSSLLQMTEIKCADFSKILDVVKKNDFVYFDPPYVPLSDTSNFTSYTKDGFDINMQIRLKEVCDELNSIGVKFLLSNSDSKLVNDLYSDYNIRKVYASRQINANAEGRGKISEVLVRNY